MSSPREIAQGAVPHRCHYPGMVAALEQRGVKLIDEDERMLQWMAKWDRPTCEWFVSIVTRAAAAGEAAGKAGES